MTLHPKNHWDIPKQTARVAYASFPKGNVYMTMYDELGNLYQDGDFEDLFPVRRGQSAISPGCLALITIMQFAEGLTDIQAAEAVRSRIDWKYVLGLELTDPGFDQSVLCEFRNRLLEHGLTNKLLDLMLSRFEKQNLIKHRGKQRTDSTHVLAAIRQLNRLELVGETLRNALNEIADIEPEWLKSIISNDWFDRYSRRLENYRLPKKQEERGKLGLKIGIYGHHLLEQIWFEGNKKNDLRQLESVEILRQIWVQQYTFIDNQLVWRKPGESGLPPSSNCITSPYDIEARNSTKRDVNWTGYKVHITETCEPKNLNVITNIETTSATNPDGEVTSIVHNKLAQKNLSPGEHYVDAAYVDAYQLVEAKNMYHVSVIGPVGNDNSWQAKSDTGFDISVFMIDWDKQVAKCPQGHLSHLWRKTRDCNNNPLIEILFEKKICTICPVRSNCTSAKKAPRKLKLRPRDEHQALVERRQQQITKEFEQDYSRRAGIEGTISQAIGRFNLRRTRYCGLAKTHLQHVATACAINLSRFFAWSKHIHKSQTRTSSFAKLNV
ncbi:MAG: IS1182 family transposase [Calothrix sp. MO_167.B42]|nr:IS1182 family transposase [Calothrix sp. MO_167.B42]